VRKKEVRRKKEEIKKERLIREEIRYSTGGPWFFSFFEDIF
jgi:hypothetical protein